MTDLESTAETQKREYKYLALLGQANRKGSYRNGGSS